MMKFSLNLIVWSLSARRAWIEIVALKGRAKLCQVALRKESVDRNYIIKITKIWGAASLSARRAWIEICRAGTASAGHPVALRKESVDRNLLWWVLWVDRVDVALRKESVDRNM